MQALDAMADWPVDVVSAGVLGRDAVVAVTGDVARPFEWASITKVCTALATLVAVEDLTLSLEEPLGPPGATVAHLLAHASGLPAWGTVPVAPPGRRRIYSNTGFEILGGVLEERSDIAFADYLHQGVCAPLGMDTARLTPGSSAATGMVGSLGDLLALGRELLSPRLLAPPTHHRATRVAFPGLAGVLPGFGHQDPCDWGLGVEVRGTKRPHWTGSSNSTATFGHFGQSGGFLWVDPVPGVALAVLSDRPFGPWAAAAWPALSDAVVAELSGLSDLSEPAELADRSHVDPGPTRGEGQA
jgi:CubicO group peptidase (beta-lactamase class C family)